MNGLVAYNHLFKENPMRIEQSKAYGIHLLYPEVCTFPVNPIKVANKLGIKVLKDTSENNPDGYYAPKQNAIYLNTERSLLRRRYVVSCELGRAMLYEYPSANPNIFALSLFAPEEAIRKCLLSGYSFLNLCEYFGVSQKHLAEWIKFLGII